MLNNVIRLRKIYPPGTKIQLIMIDDAQAPPSGTIGTVTCVDDIGTIHMKSNNGSSLGLVSDDDKFVIVKE